MQESISSLHSVLENRESKVIELEKEITKQLSNKEENDVNVFLFRSYTNLMIVLRDIFVTNRGFKSEICRQSMVYISEWFLNLLKTDYDLLPNHYDFSKITKINLNRFLDRHSKGINYTTFDSIFAST